jgi:hypothetical protein
MKNPKTTVAGYLTLAIAILTTVYHVLTGGFSAIGSQDIPAVLAALAGIGLISASDGGH